MGRIPIFSEEKEEDDNMVYLKLKEYSNKQKDILNSYFSRGLEGMTNYFCNAIKSSCQVSPYFSQKETRNKFY